MTENVYKHLTIAQKRYSYDNDRHVCQTSVSQRNELLLIARPPLAPRKSRSMSTDRLTYYKFISRFGGQSHVTSGYFETLIVYKNSILVTVPIERAMHVFPSEAGADKGTERGFNIENGETKARGPWTTLTQDLYERMRWHPSTKTKKSKAQPRKAKWTRFSQNGELRELEDVRSDEKEANGNVVEGIVGHT